MGALMSCDHVEAFRIGHLKAKFVACRLLISVFQNEKWQETKNNIKLLLRPYYFHHKAFAIVLF